MPARPRTLLLVHTSLRVALLLDELARPRLRRGERILHVVISQALEDLVARGSLGSASRRQIREALAGARELGAGAVVVSCSSVPLRALALCSVPAIRLDQPMAAEAVRLGKRIGLFATLASTLKPSAELLRRVGRELALHPVIRPVICQATPAGLRRAIRASADRLDVAVCAQASMHPLAEAVRKHFRVPILSSPVSGLAAGLSLLRRDE